MSNGGGKTGRQLEQPSTWRRRVGAEDFPQAIAKISVTQVCESEGFQAFQQSALEMLSDVGSRYILNIGKSAHQYANLAGRVECNVFDVIRGLEDMGSVQGFTGASDSDHCLESSGIVREIVQFVNEGEPIPFAHPIPRFPIVKERILYPSYIQRGEETPEDHIPAWLPAFPVPQGHSESPTGNGKRTETHADKLELESGNVKDERPLLMVSNLFEKSTLIDPADGKAKIVAVEGNPFLAAPLRIGDNEVASVAPPCKLFKVVALDNPVVENVVEDKSFSVLQTFGPAIETMQSTCYDSKDNQTKVLLNKKPTVRFKIGMRNKFLGSSTGLTHQREEHQKTSPRFTMESEKDDRKMRAEKILRESLENSDLLVQL